MHLEVSENQVTVAPAGIHDILPDTEILHSALFIHYLESA